jgi:hypothetical protein
MSLNLTAAARVSPSPCCHQDESVGGRRQCCCGTQADESAARYSVERAKEPPPSILNGSRKIPAVTLRKRGPSHQGWQGCTVAADAASTSTAAIRRNPATRFKGKQNVA